MSVKDYYFTFGVNENARVHIAAVSKFVAKEIMRTGFAELWQDSYLEDVPLLGEPIERT